MQACDALVVGAGPAGLMAAEALSIAGRKVTICEAKPSPARKFLMAGKSGLNLTKDEPFDIFAGRYGCDRLVPMLRAFGPNDVCAWARDLGQDVFTGSSGRVFPVAMKASPLLRSWLARLSGRGAELRSGWRWTGFDGSGLAFTTPAGPCVLCPGVTVLALGGASWSRLGSDGAWVPWLAGQGVGIAPFRPANMGFEVQWSAHMAPHFGKPVKAAALLVGGQTQRGEFVISGRGLEGSGIYAVSSALRDGAPLALDLLPDRSVADLSRRLAQGDAKATTGNLLRKSLGLDPVRIALLQEWGRPLPRGAALARLVKALPVPLTGPRPLDEAISSAGGVTWDSLDAALQLTALPGVFAAGEMLDWEAPTGGYLLTACLATGLWAGRAAAAHQSLPGQTPRQ
ncbi:MAG: TIGR03862 family flavoprotein [Rhodobacteraceae bacterium]|nr:TIGR03862 family flavoprotein [Paracoccaceae bacterium]